MSQDEQQVYQVGKIGITLGGVWSTENTYEILTIVSHDGGSYIALQSVPTNTEITNTDYWQCLALKGDTGDTGETGATGASGADGADGADASLDDLPTASTTTAGIVQLSDAVNSTSTTEASTANAVKTAYDLANGALRLTDSGNGLEIGSYINFHNADSSTDYDARLSIDSTGNLIIDGNLTVTGTINGQTIN